MDEDAVASVDVDALVEWSAEAIIFDKATLVSVISKYNFF